MFSPLSRGYAPWTSDLYDIYKDEATFSKDKLPNLEPEIHRHGITVTPRSRATSAASHKFLFKEPTDGKINLPKTYLTRKGALVLFTAQGDEDEDQQQNDSEQEQIIRLQQANEIIRTSLRLGTSERLSKAILQFGDEEYDKETASVSDEKSKMFLKFLHKIDDRDVDFRSQPGSELSAYLRDLKSRASSRLSFSGDTHLPRSREALELRAILRGLQEDNWPISYPQDGTSEQFTRPASQLSSRTGSPVTSTTATPRPILSAKKLAASLKSLNSYLGRSSPGPPGIENDGQGPYQTTISASVTRKLVTSPVSDIGRNATFSPQGQKLLPKRSHPTSITGSSILEEDEGTGFNDNYVIPGTDRNESGLDELEGDGDLIDSGDGVQTSALDSNNIDTKTVITEGSDGSDLEILYRAGESDNSKIEMAEGESTTSHDITSDALSGQNRTINLVAGGTELYTQNASISEEYVNEFVDAETNTTISEDYFDASTIKVDFVKKPVTGTIQEEEVIASPKGQGHIEVKARMSPEVKVAPSHTQLETGRINDTFVKSKDKNIKPSTELGEERELPQMKDEVGPKVEGVTREASLLEEVTQALEDDAASVASSVLIEQDIELPPEEPEDQAQEQEEQLPGIRRISLTQKAVDEVNGSTVQSQQYTGLTGRTSGGGFAIDSSLPDASVSEVPRPTRSTSKQRKTSRPPSQTGSTGGPASRTSSVGRKSPDYVRDSLENLASSAFIDKSEPETLVAKHLDTIGKIVHQVEEANKPDIGENEPIKEGVTSVTKPDTKLDDERKKESAKSEPRKESEKKSEIKPKSSEKPESKAKTTGKSEQKLEPKTEMVQKPEQKAEAVTKSEPESESNEKVEVKEENKADTEKNILDSLKAAADQMKGKKDVKKGPQGRAPRSPSQKQIKSQQSKNKQNKVNKVEEKKDYSDVLDITSVQPDETESKEKEVIVKEQEEITPRLRKKVPPEKEKVIVPDFVAEMAERDDLSSYNELQKGVNKMSEMIDSELSAPTLDNLAEGLTAEELELAKKAMAEKVSKAKDKLNEMESPRPKKKKVEEKGKAQGKKGKKSKEQQNEMQAERARIKEQQRLEKLKRLEEVKALQDKITAKEEERKAKEREARDREIEIKLEMDRLAKEAEQIQQAEEDVRHALAESRKKQREEREARRKAELERKKQEVIDKRERERKAMMNAAKNREQDMLSSIEDHEIKKRFQEDEARKLDEEERLASERLEEEMEELRRKAEEEEEREREIERMADEEAIQRLRDEEEEKDRERRRLAEEKQKMEEEKERERQLLLEEQQILLEQRRRREEEEDRMREEEKKRLFELQRMEEEARKIMQQEVERRREAALYRREKNLERRANLDRIKHGQGVTKPWVFSYFINWPRENYMRPMGEDPNKKKPFRPKPKPKPPPPKEGDKSAPGGT